MAARELEECTFQPVVTRRAQQRGRAEQLLADGTVGPTPRDPLRPDRIERGRNSVSALVLLQLGSFLTLPAKGLRAIRNPALLVPEPP